MKVDVIMRDGRTVHRVERRADVGELMRRDPRRLDEHKPIQVLTRRFTNGDFERNRLLVLSANAISYISVYEEQT